MANLYQLANLSDDSFFSIIRKIKIETRETLYDKSCSEDLYNSDVMMSQVMAVEQKLQIKGSLIKQLLAKKIINLDYLDQANLS